MPAGHTRDLPSAFTTARQIAGSPWLEPGPGMEGVDQTATVVIRRYHQDFGSYSPLALDTADATYTTHYLVSERIYDKIDDLIFFERRYAKVPATRSEPLHTAYTFPAFLYDPAERPPLTKAVAGRMEIQYFLNADPTDPTTGVAVVPAFEVILDAQPGYVVPYVADAINITDPTLTEYEALVAGEDEIVAAASEIIRYLGNIWERRTLYVIAQ